MRIRCKKCFKKYDDQIGECPRCGTINDRDYLDDIESVEPTNKVFSLSERFLKKYYCSFCHTAKLIEDNNCPYCKNSDNLKSSNPTLSSDVLDSVSAEMFRETESRVNKRKFLNLMTSKGFDVKEWQVPFEYKFGSESPIIIIITVVVMFMMLLSSTTRSGDGYGTRLLIGLIITGAVSTALYFMRHLFFSEYLMMSKKHNNDVVSFVYRKKASNSRDGLQTLLDVSSDQLKKIEIEVDDESGQCLRMILHTKDHADVSLRVVDINMRHYTRRGHIELILLLLTNKLDLPLYIKRLNVISKDYEAESLDIEKTVKSVYVRIDQFMSEPSKELSDAHQTYFSLIKEERYLKSGSLDKSGKMTLFMANDIKEATAICDEDPFVLNNIVQYTLSKWDVNINNL